MHFIFIIITSAPPQIIRHQILEVEDPWARKLALKVIPNTQSDHSPVQKGMTYMAKARQIPTDPATRIVHGGGRSSKYLKKS